MPGGLSVCLLTRDEERTIERVLRSVADVADEIIVADTGSLDRTVERARALGARVVRHEWVEDFSAGRNAALAEATRDWILWLNPDEELDESSRELLRRLTSAEADPRVFGYLVKVRSIPRAERLDMHSETYDPRLFRRRPDALYVGRAHPGLSSTLGEAVAREGLHVEPSGIVIRHHAYDSTVTKAKLRWGIRLLEKELQDRPGRLPTLVEYARNLIMLDPDDPRGHEAMAQAVALVEPHFDDAQAPHPDAQRVLEYLLDVSPARSRVSVDPARAEMLALKWFPVSPPLLWLLAGRFFQSGRFEAASTLLERLLGMGATGNYDHALPFDPRILGGWALVNLAQCLRALGRGEQARRCLEPLRSDPEFRDEAESILADMNTPPS